MKTIVIVEGPDYTGKSGLCAGLSQWMNANKIQHMQTREPGGTEYAEKLRTLLKTHRMNPEALLSGMFSGRYDLFQTIVNSEIDTWIDDRSSMTSYVYQVYYGNRETMLPLFEAMQSRLDSMLEGIEIKYIILDVNTDKRIERELAARGERAAEDAENDVIEQQHSNHLRLRQGYEEALDYFKQTGRLHSYCRIDTSYISPAQVLDQALKYLVE